MIELRGDRLVFTSEVHPRARFSMGFQRTLRIPDDGVEYPLPAGLGWFPLRHVDDHAATVPATWLRRGGVIAPMHAAEALWISFGSHDPWAFGSGDPWVSQGAYPWAVKVAAGKINAVSGEPWSTQLHGPATPGARRRRRQGAPQDYLVIPDQPWLDGFNVESGRIRQFVAMPLGGGHTAEEQLTGRAEVGGLQVVAYPMRAERYEALVSRWAREEARRDIVPQASAARCFAPEQLDMGLGLGGLMRQDVESDPHGAGAWDLDHPARCFIHLANAEQWPAITGEPMPTQPISRAEYARAGIPWFDYAAPGPKAPGSQVLEELRTVAEVEEAAGGILPDDGPIPVDRIARIPVRPRRRGPAVREDTWLD